MTTKTLSKAGVEMLSMLYLSFQRSLTHKVPPSIQELLTLGYAEYRVGQTEIHITQAGKDALAVAEGRKVAVPCGEECGASILVRPDVAAALTAAQG